MPKRDELDRIRQSLRRAREDAEAASASAQSSQEAGQEGKQATKPATSPIASPEPPEDDDAALFRSAIGPVRELPQGTPPPQKPKPRPTTRMAERDDDEARSEFRRLLDSPQLQAGDAMRYRRDDVPERVLQRLGRGQYAAQDEIDLHRCDASLAEAVLRRFLKEARDEGIGCVRIVHGKGLHADSGLPTLKNLVDRLLRQRSDVLAFHSAPTAQGGTGAVLVLLAPA
jgi:DNA-nicking Smr family endonuclease